MEFHIDDKCKIIQAYENCIANNFYWGDACVHVTIFLSLQV